MNNKYNISILGDVIQQIYKCTDLEEGKKLMTDFINERKIKELDKRKMLFELNNVKSLIKLHFYVTNAMFKFEGLGVSDFKKS